jgi:hypothetical protein
MEHLAGPSRTSTLRGLPLDSRCHFRRCTSRVAALPVTNTGGEYRALSAVLKKPPLAAARSRVTLTPHIFLRTIPPPACNRRRHWRCCASPRRVVLAPARQRGELRASASRHRPQLPKGAAEAGGCRRGAWARPSATGVPATPCRAAAAAAERPNHVRPLCPASLCFITSSPLTLVCGCAHTALLRSASLAPGLTSRRWAW